MRTLLIVTLMLVAGFSQSAELVPASAAVKAEKPVIAEMSKARMAEVEKLHAGGAWERVCAERYDWYFYTCDVVENDGTKKVGHFTFMHSKKCAAGGGNPAQNESLNVTNPVPHNVFQYRIDTLKKQGGAYEKL